MPRVGFEPTTPAKTFRALDRGDHDGPECCSLGSNNNLCVRQLGMKYAGGFLKFPFFASSFV
jgi:hypothetical protein